MSQHATFQIFTVSGEEKLHGKEGEHIMGNHVEMF